MNTLFLEPTDVLFFRDGRPMSGSLSGHGAAWPLPTVTNAALHAALHRADLEKSLDGNVHRHDHRYREGKDTDSRRFGSLVTAGPFPVHIEGRAPTWFFPRPLDAGGKDNDFTSTSYFPLTGPLHPSSLPAPLRYPVANKKKATKDAAASWWSKGAWNAYLDTPSDGAILFKTDSDFSKSEHMVGIGIDPSKGTQDGEQFYSAHYLRLNPGWHLGLFSEALDKINDSPTNKRDLLHALFPNSGTQTPVIVGGQQRLCTVTRHSGGPLPLPTGKGENFATNGEGESKRWLVKWILLTPAIFPEINHHHGGWLPSWIRHTDGQVMLKSGDIERRHGEGRDHWRERVKQLSEISSTLVAAMVGKPIPVTGYALANEADPARTQGGAKSLHLAVPAGSVYYFEADSKESAKVLAAALNWHGADAQPTTIRNRRSTLMGEKGFGLGVCGTWQFHAQHQPLTWNITPSLSKD